MILGVGNDIVEIARIKNNIEKYGSRFLNRVFTPHEQEYCLNRKEPSLHFAGRFAAKEAVVKAFSTGFSKGLSWTDIEIHNETSGKPFVVCSPKVIELFGTPNIQISISHCDQYATAFAVWSELDKLD